MRLRDESRANLEISDLSNRGEESPFSFVVCAYAPQCVDVEEEGSIVEGLRHEK